MNEIIFKIAFIVLWIAYIAIRAPFDSKHRKVQRIKIRNVNQEKFLLILLGIGLMLIPLVWMFTPFLNEFDMGIPIYWRWFGVVLALLSLVYFWRIHQVLGTNWSPTLEIKQTHQLIRTGPYRRIRHPMYTQIWIWVIAQALITSNFYAGLSGILVWTVAYFIRVPKEEEMMLEHFGEEYRKYMKQTGRVLPKLTAEPKK